MNYVEYSKELNAFAYQYKLTTVNYILDDTKQRVIISRLYYALLHHYFNKYPHVASSTAGQKHSTILKIIERQRQREYRLFQTLKKLREWADYRPLESSPFPINLANLLHQVNKIINR